MTAAWPWPRPLAALAMAVALCGQSAALRAEPTSTSSAASTDPGADRGVSQAPAARAAPEAAAGLAQPLSQPAVAILAPAGVRLGDRVRRELAAAGFAPRLVPLSDQDWQGRVRALPVDLQRGVATLADGRVIVFSRGPGGSPQIRRILTPSRRDPLAPRRVALAVVEILRLGIVRHEPRPATDEGARSPCEPPSCPSPASASDRTAQASGEPAPASLAPPGSPAGVAPGLAFTPAIASSGAVSEAATVFPAAALASAVVVATAGESAPAPQPQPWAFGAATTVNLDSSSFGPTSHVQMTALFRVRRSVRPFVRVLWPLLGAQFVANERLVRLWTTGASTGVEFPVFATARLRPFVGGEVGLRLVLTEADKDVGFTPAARAGLVGGVRYAVFPLVELTLEGATEWSRPLALASTQSYEREAAAARAARLSLGVLFEY